MRQLISLTPISTKLKKPETIRKHPVKNSFCMHTHTQTPTSTPTHTPPHTHHHPSPPPHTPTNKPLSLISKTINRTINAQKINQVTG